MKRVCIIGAGPSGLPSLKECLEAGFDSVLFEMAPRLGGLWNYTPVPGDVQGQPEVHSSVYKNTVINSAKGMTAYSDFPAWEDYPVFMSHEYLQHYMQAYAKRFGLLPHIRFNSKVLRVEPLHSSNRHVSDSDSTTSSDEQSSEPGPAASGCEGSPVSPAPAARWRVTFSSNGVEKSEEFDAVLVATGHHSTPRMPSFPGMDEFEGQQMHSHYYRDPVDFKGKRVLVVGMGNSGVDIAVETSYVAEEVHMAVRSGAWVWPRWLFGQPITALLTRFSAVTMTYAMRQRVFAWLLRQVHGDPAAYGISAPRDPQAQHPTIHQGLYDRIATGKVQMHPNVSRLGPGKWVTLEDGRKLEVDVVVYATGYKLAYPFLDPSLLGPSTNLDKNQVALYKLMVPLTRQALGSLFFIGLFQPLGAVATTSEMQARLAAQVLLGAVKLPDLAVMQKEVADRKAALDKQYKASARHTIQVETPPFCDEMAAMIGCLPSWSSLLLRDPALWSTCMFKPWVPQQYRLQGPGSRKEAREWVMRVVRGYGDNTQVKSVKDLTAASAG
mmetsp:Transcript_23510/g.51596  ORF Transcript_23510/g.51596 Transcript_23510/m.51596 type:complete len:552 (+) Transcript_23510:253-1908(+)|eukprot:CAMPEP_0202891630 /NCGR_PEP_ID=MMETSP1392-20130828/1640_1 /ASSEMBLY_ACC=CAM_ASM_000868 /TAXON_ID=225041 /ORGANISM="Chlamydomonas chlamydogama, Strain SAG 11-48b" /LENGTH=551 /DNA_ID=CAMNT_0049575439 /DNA_START=231 /DNA_END=1886 /DNA_ORIENTATION=+